LTTGVTTRFQTAGYQPFVVNHLISRNLDTKIFYYDKMKNLSVQLAYKLGGFTDKENLKVLTDIMKCLLVALQHLTNKNILIIVNK